MYGCDCGVILRCADLDPCSVITNTLASQHSCCCCCCCSPSTVASVHAVQLAWQILTFPTWRPKVPPLHCNTIETTFLHLCEVKIYSMFTFPFYAFSRCFNPVIKYQLLQSKCTHTSMLTRFLSQYSSTTHAHAFNISHPNDITVDNALT